MVQHRSWLPWLVCLALMHAGTAREHGLISTTTPSCQAEYKTILKLPIYNKILEDGQYDCKKVIQDSFTIQDGVGCTAYDTMIGCFQLAPDNWTSFVQRCDTIFSSASNCIVQGTAWSDCSRPDDATTHYVVGQLEGGTVNTVNSYSFDSGFIDNAGSGWQTREYVGGDSDKRRKLQQISDNEGGGGGTGLDAGCFPDFYDIADWQAWLDGTYQEPIYGGNTINPIGVIFWLLQGLGILSMAFI